MSLNGGAPQFTAKMTKRGVPFAGIALDLSALCLIALWATIAICQIQLCRWSTKGIVESPRFRLFGTPYTSYATLVFPFTVTAQMRYWNLIAPLVSCPP